MLRYLFTNDIRISSLNQRLKDAAEMVQTDSVPSAKEDKSLNNNINTLAFYFNLYKDNNNTLLAMNGDIKSVLINFMEKFQFPNPRTKESFEDSKKDNIRLKPYQEILRLLYIGRFNNTNFCLTSEEIFYFIFLNPDVVNEKNKDYNKILNQILEYKEASKLPGHIKIKEGVDWIWNQKKRQINEMLGIMNWLDYVKYENNELRVIDTDLNIQTKGSLFDILTSKDFLDAQGLEFNEFKEKYIRYMEIKESSLAKKEAPNVKSKIDMPYQRIFFGAPGTGKSYQLNKEAKKYFTDNYERVTFHPNYMYGSFVGTYKPTMEGNGSDRKIIYDYVPGPFMRLYVRALKSLKSENPEPYLLIIEEINRANVAAVFGDVFQLLDRGDDGSSEYPIQVSEDIKRYLAKELGGDSDDYTSIKIPSNMYIWATMNSADQGVMPMDTAFKRRWDFKYLGINDAADENKDDFKKYRFNISKDGNETVLWDDFRRAINKKLSVNLPEDKLIGPYFISKSVLKTDNLDILTETIKNKVLMYLYEDAAKPIRSSLFAEGKFSTYSSLCDNFDKNALTIFKGGLDIKQELSNETNDEETDDSEENKDVANEVQ